MPARKRQGSGGRQLVAVVAGCALALALGACQQAPQGNATAEQAVATSLRLTAAGDFDDLMKNRLPAAYYATWRAEWTKAHAQPVPASVAQEDQFAKVMHMLTEPDAESKLTKRLAPVLARMHGATGAPMPVFGSILKAAGKQMIADAPQLGPAQKGMASAGLDALAAWAGTVDFSDPDKARKAIDVACATARQLHVQTLAQWRALDYASSMRNYQIIWTGLERVLKVYGLDLAGALEGAKVTTVIDDGARATVKLGMNFADRRLVAQWPMRQVGGHWYAAALLDAWHNAHPRPTSGGSALVPAAGTAQPAAAPPATRGTPATAATVAAPAHS